MERLNIENKGLNFTNLLSGPARIGRVFNYIIKIGNNELKDGSTRAVEQEADGYGDSWCLKWMLGLEIIEHGEEISPGVFKLLLTTKGKKIKELFDKYGLKEFDSVAEPYVIKFQLATSSSEVLKSILTVLDEIFRDSFIFKILTMYLNENGYIYDKSQEFKTEFFNKVKTCYSNITTEGNPDARTSTGANRVPSLIQLCQFLDYVTVVNFGHNISGLLFNESLFKSDENNTSINKASISSFKGTNILFYGVPGCGKSRLIKTQYCNNEAYMERVVFHPDYTYSDFVGQIMPVLKGTIKSEKNNNIETMKNNNKYMVDDSQKFKAADGHESYVTDDKTKVVYEFVPGPFTRILKKAINDSDNNYFLIIEEITRGNAAAIFGDIFQLLDRQENESEYGITNSDIAREIYGDRKENELIKIPSNLTLLATMNTSDQNVFPLDNAFKRRWELKMVPNTFDVGDKLAKNVIRNTTISWQAFMETINDLIIDNNQSISSLEDKRLGTHFINEDEMNDEELFAEKVLMYLWNDVFKLNRDDIFKTDYKTLESLIDGYKSIHFNIFNNEIMNMIDTRQSQIEETESAKGATVDVEKSSAE